MKRMIQTLSCSWGAYISSFFPSSIAFIFLAFSVIITACSTKHSSYKMLVQTHTPKSYNCKIDVFRASYPDREFEKISRIDVHIERTYFMNSAFDDVLPAIRKRACESGADAIIDIRERSSKINLGETNLYHVTVTGIKYKNPTP